MPFGRVATLALFGSAISVGPLACESDDSAGVGGSSGSGASGGASGAPTREPQRPAALGVAADPAAHQPRVEVAEVQAPRQAAARVRVGAEAAQTGAPTHAPTVLPVA